LISLANMVLASSVAGLFKWRQFEPEMILLAVGWYLRFSLSYRDVEELLAERGLSVDHVTVWRWVQRYAPEIQRRLRPRVRLTNDSWRVDETYIRVKGKWVYLYRAVDSTGATIDFLLSAKRDAAAAERFLVKALGGENHPAPRVINRSECRNGSENDLLSAVVATVRFYTRGVRAVHKLNTLALLFVPLLPETPTTLLGSDLTPSE